jgi:metallophosphoesterase (TIGR00282 family)
VQRRIHADPVTTLRKRPAPPGRGDPEIGEHAGGRGGQLAGRVRLGNAPNAGSARPSGACRVLLIGDVIGKPGRLAVEAILPGLREERGIDFVTANGENLAGGLGLTVSTAEALLGAGVDVITSGNHIWDKREIYDYLDRTDRVLRPLNYGTHNVPGRGWGTYQALDGTDLAVINLQGRTTMQPIDNPFTEADRLFDEASEPLPPVRLVDFHCELTSEKNAMGLHLDGRVSAVVGTHTHVVTGDERILPGGTAYQSDIGMTGPIWSVIGFDPKTVLPRFINALPTRFEVGHGTVIMNAVQVDIDPATGRALAIERFVRLHEDSAG